jgi:hypothetical protein
MICKFVLSFLLSLFIFVDGSIFLQRVISEVFLFFAYGSSCKIIVILFWIFDD